MPELGVHCQAIMESRHVDVIEMDAASHTGIDDVREIIENARYRPVSARTKVYIVDEVHMLSKQAFNGLLKTLEEPPEHVKFLFATTEIEKVPITVRSRCIRFDLKRIETGAMVRHLEKICAAEGVVAEPDALALIARVAEGSVRDALSLLDQGIAHGAAGTRRGRRPARDARALRPRRGHRPLRSRDGGRDRAGARSDGAPASRRRRSGGAARSSSPSSAISSPAPSSRRTASTTPRSARTNGGAAPSWRERLALGPLTRAWQILIKGVEDVKDSPRPLASAEMALIRLAFAADLPTPEDALRKLAESGEAAPRLASARAAPAVVALRRAAAPRRCAPPRRRRRRPRRSAPIRPRRASRASRTSSRWRASNATFSSVQALEERRAARPLRTGAYRIFARRGRLVGDRPGFVAAPRRNGRASAGWCARRGGERADLARTGGGAAVRAPERRRRPSGGAQGSRALSRRARSSTCARPTPLRPPRRPPATTTSPTPTRSATTISRGWSPLWSTLWE